MCETHKVDLPSWKQARQNFDELKSDFLLLCSYSLLHHAAYTEVNDGEWSPALALALSLCSNHGLLDTTSTRLFSPSLFLKLLRTLNTPFSFMFNGSMQWGKSYMFNLTDLMKCMYLTFLSAFYSRSIPKWFLKGLPKAQRTWGLSDVTKITSLVHITSSYTNLDQTRPSKGSHHFKKVQFFF